MTVDPVGDLAAALVAWMRLQKSSVQWVYHPRKTDLSDFVRRQFLADFLEFCPEFAADARDGRIVCDLNVTVAPEPSHRRRKLDLVVGPPVSQVGAVMSAAYPLRKAKVASLLLSLEVKFCMTEHRKATSRLIDELCSSVEVVRLENPAATCMAVVIVNLAPKFTSPLKLPGPNLHERPYEIDRLVARLLSRVPLGAKGYDALALGFVDTDNETTFELGRPRVPVPADREYGASMRMIADRYVLMRR